MNIRSGLGALLVVTLAMTSGTASAIVARDYGSDLVRHQRELRACAGAHRGSVTLELDITGRGQLRRGSVVESSSDEMRQVGECVLRAARGWTFQTSTSGGMGRYVLVAADDAVEVRRRRGH